MLFAMLGIQILIHNHLATNGQNTILIAFWSPSSHQTQQPEPYVPTIREIFLKECCVANETTQRQFQQRMEGQVNGLFVPESLIYEQHIMYRLQHRLPFAHVRWGDGEMKSAARPKNDYARELAKALVALSTHPLASVNVGTWWLAGPKNLNMRAIWNKIVPPTPPSSSLLTNTSTSFNDTVIPQGNSPVTSQEASLVQSSTCMFHDSFYLPNGEVVNDGMNHWISNGVVGWIPLMERYYANRTILIGPSHLTDVPFLTDQLVAYISSDKIEHNISRTKKVVQQIIHSIENRQARNNVSSSGNDYEDDEIDEEEPLLFLVAAGRSAKIIISDLIARPNNTHSFVDVGSSLDAYVGKHSRDYNNPSVYCEKIMDRDPTRLHYWMKKGVCKKQEQQLRRQSPNVTASALEQKL